MKVKWLLLMTSVLCLLVLFPAAALSQVPVADAGCGTATVDGVVGTDEWATATVVDLAVDVMGGEVSRAQVPAGVMLVMNDLTHLYVAALLDWGFVVDPDYWYGEMSLRFSDEGDSLDGVYDAPDCDPLPGEGYFRGSEDHAGLGNGVSMERFTPMSALGPCDNQPLIGVAWDANLGTVWEWAIDLRDSELDKVGPGDCFRFASEIGADACDQGSGCGNTGNWDSAVFMWPASHISETPGTFGTLCLNPCGGEFVPEPGSVMLLASGLVGLAGYAGLRLRKK